MKPYSYDYALEQMKLFNSLIKEKSFGKCSIEKKTEYALEDEGYMYKIHKKTKSNHIILKNGEEVLMDLCKKEIQGAFVSIKMAKGKVAVAGLGLGYVPYIMALKKEVSKVIVYEKNKDVIELYNRNFKYNPKIDIINIDAFEAKSEHFDFYYVDIYNYELSDKVVYDYEKLNKLHQIEEYSFWGIEHFLLSCNYNDIMFVYLPEGWAYMAKFMYGELESHGYLDYYYPLDADLVRDVLMKFKKILN
ncbi:hypothetical protein [Clostridium sp. BJN0001]|uniref:hypothetical protein n=1 Tax=Clostridium sp. BJN0001 TaxID=2930219 RepID=UPI001FD3E9A6|nr:hypothetical protein [Clostridium sp. BJN0001]